MKYTAKVKTEDQLSTVLADENSEALMLDYALIKSIPAMDERKGKKIFISMPEVLRELRAESVAGNLRQLFEEKDFPDKGLPVACSNRNLSRPDGVVIKNIDEIGFVKKCGLFENVIGDAFLYAYNCRAVSFYKNEFPGMKFILSDELTDDENAELVKRSGLKPEEFFYKIYGHQVLMVTNQCFQKNYGGCKNDDGIHRVDFFDEKENRFIAVSKCREGACEILSGRPVLMLDKQKEILEKLGKINFLLDFTIESKKETERILSLIQKENPEKMDGISRGHHYRGID